MLTCECGIFPVIDGIPVLDRRHNERRLVALLKQGAFSTATSECLMVDVQRGVRRGFSGYLEIASQVRRAERTLRAHKGVPYVP